MLQRKNDEEISVKIIAIDDEKERLDEMHDIMNVFEASIFD